MTGSYKHVTKDGTFNSDAFYNGIENLGDAYECVEELCGMVADLRAELAQQREALRGHMLENKAEIERLTRQRDALAYAVACYLSIGGPRAHRVGCRCGGINSNGLSCDEIHGIASAALAAAKEG